MPALLEVTVGVRNQRPRGLLGVPVHGAVFEALELYQPALSLHLHEAQIKPFRIGAVDWKAAEEEEMAQVSFQIGLLDDSLISDFLQALQIGTLLGRMDDTFYGETLDCQVVRHESYEAMYSRHVSMVTGRHLHFELLTPTTFKANDIDSPFPVPKTVFYGLQKRWEAFCNLHMGEELNDWISRSVRVDDYRLFPRNASFKGQRGSQLKASVGEVTFQIARPSESGPLLVRLLTEYANYSGIGYKTTYGLGHVYAHIN